MLIPVLTKEAASQLNPLQLAHVGDAVHALMVRGHLAGKNLSVHDMHLTASQSVSAVSQEKISALLLPVLTEEEAAIYRRGRNAHARHGAPKSAGTGAYAAATGVEAVLGFLYLTGNEDRILELTPLLISAEKAL